MVCSVEGSLKAKEYCVIDFAAIYVLMPIILAKGCLIPHIYHLFVCLEDVRQLVVNHSL